MTNERFATYIHRMVGVVWCLSGNDMSILSTGKAMLRSVPGVKIRKRATMCRHAEYGGIERCIPSGGVLYDGVVML